MRFANKVCIVSGGASGIGRETARRLTSEGAKTIVVDISEHEGNELVREIARTGGQALFAKADVGVSGDVQGVVNMAVQKWGRIDVLINNAAMMTFKPVLELSEDEWDRVMAVNLRSAFLFCKHSLPYMERGAIVNVSSIHAHRTSPNVVPYAASKAGVEAFTRGLSIECEALRVRVNSVAPGPVDTPMLWSNPNVKSGVEKIADPVAKPADLAAVICFLASEESTAINGATLIVDGGLLRRLA